MMGSRPSGLEPQLQASLERAAEALRKAGALLICTGAGMGVDSGLGTFRGRYAGVWPPLKALCLDYTDISNPQVFEDDPRLAWAYWGFCIETYKKCLPHAGYSILARWGSSMRHGLFSVTSNIDGHWARTRGVGPKKTYEVHGAVTHWQCMKEDGRVWPLREDDMADMVLPKWDLSPGEQVEVQQHIDSKWIPATVAPDGCSIIVTHDEVQSRIGVHAVRRPGKEDLCRIVNDANLPKCRTTGQQVRPNVLMFGDIGCCPARISAQHQTFEKWTDSLPEDVHLVVVEIGAGNTIPTIRLMAEETCQAFTHATLIRINMDDSDIDANVSGNAVSIGGLGALRALSEIDALLGSSHRQSKAASSRNTAGLHRGSIGCSMNRRSDGPARRKPATC